MWMLIAREPIPDAPYWPGRRWLAAIDAVAWPWFWVLVLQHMPGSKGMLVPFAVGVALLCAMGRLSRAVGANHRYRFTTWRWGRIAMGLIVIGAVMKVAMAV